MKGSKSNNSGSNISISSTSSSNDTSLSSSSSSSSEQQQEEEQETRTKRQPQPPSSQQSSTLLHCMRCHKSFTESNNNNDELACVMILPYPYQGPHTIDARQVDYTKFDICDLYSCGTVLHSFTLHLKLMQEERECYQLEEQLKQEQEQIQHDLEDQLELLQILKLQRNKMTTTTTQRERLKNSKWERTIDYQYYKIMGKLINQQKDNIELEEFTKNIMKEVWKNEEGNEQHDGDGFWELSKTEPPPTTTTKSRSSLTRQSLQQLRTRFKLLQKKKEELEGKEASV
eukprot:scaffold16490_cov113-Cylindrotheca_fusiformis.AAC.7